MPIKVLVFSDLHWSLGRVYRDVAHELTQRGHFEFQFLSWATYGPQQFRDLYAWCDKCLTNLVSYNCFTAAFSDLSPFSKCIFVSHGFEEHKQVTTYDKRLRYSMTSEALLPLFPNGLKLYISPNGVRPSNFTFQQRAFDKLKQLGWCGADHVWWKQERWAHQIATATGLAYSKATKLTSEELKTWYASIDLLLVTSVPHAWQETGPLPPFEAIVSGTPAIGTPVGNFRHVPGPKFTNPDEAIQIVNDFKEYPERLATLLQDQYQFVLRHYSYEALGPFWALMLLDKS